jgi:type II secretory pathway pseudopilin PulG
LFSRSPARTSAATRVQVVAVILIVALVVFLAWPAWRNALVKRDLTRTMINGRQLYLATLHMTTDGAATSDPSLTWPGDSSAASLSEYCATLVERNYLTPSGLQQILTAPGADCVVSSSSTSPVTLSGKSALKVYKAKTADPSNTIFAASSNYVYDTELNPGSVPFGDAGFVIVRKSGDAGVYKKHQATPAGFESVQKFQTDIVGVLMP